MSRHQTEDRIQFSLDDKRFILEKTNGQCAHCGCKLLHTSKNLTIEHVIPISKGGTNKIENLLALCEDCNMHKSNLVVHPYDYYPYVNKEYFDELIDMYTDYCKNVSWFSKHNFTREDAIEIPYFSRVMQLQSFVRKNKRNKTLAAPVIPQIAVFQKTTYEEHDTIVEDILKYNKKHNTVAKTKVFNEDKEKLSNHIKDTYRNGMIYKLTIHGHAIAYLPIAVEKTKFEGKEIYSFVISGLPCMYQRDEYFYPILKAISYVLQELSFLNNINAVTCRFITPTKDDFIQNIIHRHPFFKQRYKHELNENITVYNFAFTLCLHPKNIEDSLTNTSMIDTETYTLQDTIQTVSDAIQQKLEMPKLNEVIETTKGENFKKKKHNTKNTKKSNKRLKKELKRFEPDYYSDETLYI